MSSPTLTRTRGAARPGSSSISTVAGMPPRTWRVVSESALNARREYREMVEVLQTAPLVVSARSSSSTGTAPSPSAATKASTAARARSSLVRMLYQLAACGPVSDLERVYVWFLNHYTELTEGEAPERVRSPSTSAAALSSSFKDSFAVRFLASSISRRSSATPVALTSTSALSLSSATATATATTASTDAEEAVFTVTALPGVTTDRPVLDSLRRSGRQGQTQSATNSPLPADVEYPHYSVYLDMLRLNKAGSSASHPSASPGPSATAIAQSADALQNNPASPEPSFKLRAERAQTAPLRRSTHAALSSTSTHSISSFPGHSSSPSASSPDSSAHPDGMGSSIRSRGRLPPPSMDDLRQRYEGDSSGRKHAWGPTQTLCFTRVVDRKQRGGTRTKSMPTALPPDAIPVFAVRNLRTGQLDVHGTPNIGQEAAAARAAARPFSRPPAPTAVANGSPSADTGPPQPRILSARPRTAHGGMARERRLDEAHQHSISLYAEWLQGGDREDAAFHAALFIQRVFRGYLCRRSQPLVTRRRNRAAIRIQQCWRSFVLLRFLHLKKARSVTLEWAREFKALKRRDSASLDEAVLRAEALHDFLMHTRLSSERMSFCVPMSEQARRDHAATTLQAAWRGYHIRKSLNLGAALDMRLTGADPAVLLKDYNAWMGTIEEDYKHSNVEVKTHVPVSFADVAKFTARCGELKETFNEFTVRTDSKGLDFEASGRALRTAHIFSTQAELVTAVHVVTAKPKKLIQQGKVRMTQRQFVRVAFQLQEPAGMELVEPRPTASSWLNPRVEGQAAREAVQAVMGETPLQAVLELVSRAAAERRAQNHRSLGGPILPPRPLPRPPPSPLLGVLGPDAAGTAGSPAGSTPRAGTPTQRAVSPAPLGIYANSLAVSSPQTVRSHTSTLVVPPL